MFPLIRHTECINNIARGKMGEAIVNSIKQIDSTVFSAFKTLTSNVVGDRLNGSIKLMQHLTANRDEEKKSKELDYILNRLVRGLGASSCSSRSGFYSTLVAFLTCITDSKSLTVDEIFKVMEKQLHVGKEIENKEDSDAVVGRILLCGSLIQSGKLYSETNEDMLKCVNMLVGLSNHKLFHSSLAYDFLVALMSKLPSDKFNAVMWPVMKRELKRSWERQNINTIRFLLAAHSKYPDLIDSEYLLSSIKTPEILSTASFEHLIRIFWFHSAKLAISHPAYNEFAHFLAKSNAKQLIHFWQEVDIHPTAPSKLKEIITIKLLTVFFKSDSIATKTLLKLLSQQLIEVIVKSLKNVKRLNRGFLADCYDKFFDAVSEHMSKMTEEHKKVEIIKKFILHPGALLIEKYTTKKVVRQMIAHLGSEGIVHLTNIYKNVFVGELPKDPTDAKVQWLNVEKKYAVQMMQFLIGLKIMQNEVNWRIEQLTFMVAVSLFYTTKEGIPIIRRDDSGFITKDLAVDVKNMFYLTLQAKLPNLKDENRMLLHLVKFCDEIVSNKAPEKYMREPLSKKATQAWKKMFQFVSSPKVSTKKDKKLDLIFRILFMHMGLQLFSEPKMAEDAIADLEKCVEKINEKKMKSDKLNTNDEPQWIEVVVDLFLHLLSRGSKFLKIIVNTLFPHLCPAMSMTAVHQILSVLDMKDSNPLSNPDDVDENGKEEEDDDVQLNGDENEEVSQDESDDSSEDGSDDVDVEEESEEESEDDEESEEEEDNEMMDEDEGTVSDQLRNELFSVLGATSDTESIDVDDMTPEEAEKLDKNLSAVFRSRKTSTGKKKSKKERTIATTVMHFRIRVLDLIDIYMKSTPSMAICLEIILALFNMIEVCAESDLKPLSDRVDKVLVKLLKLRDFVIVTDVTEHDLRDLISGLIERKVNPVKLPNYNALLSKSVAFAVSNLHLIETVDNSVVNAIIGYAKEFLNTRNPTITFDLLQDIFKLRWIGVWEIASSLSEYGISSTKQNIRMIRRNQLLELLLIMYKNNGVISQNTKSLHKLNGVIATAVCQYVDWIHQMNNVKPKELTVLVSLLCEMYKCGTKIESLKLQKIVDWKVIGEKIQNIREKLIFAPIQSYQQFCNLLGMKMLKKSDVKAVHRNGQTDTNGETLANNKNHQKRKLEETTANNKQNKPRTDKKQKKLNKEERLRIASEGFNGISFNTSLFVDDVNME